MTERNDLGLTATGGSGGGCSCCGTASTSGAAAAPSAVTAEVMVSGMTCSHCVASVTEELVEVPGVEGVDVDLNAGGLSRVTVRSAEPIDDAAITAAIEEAGYAREDARS
ncbi:heavy-metal-associated domain-containing protein [Microbacterium imperiale]|uniref:HMA domain-containing protein n=1 Tax=Microbacterium imperiale TaxID=33884 RepID=A0A9W6M4A3_9MICO|nr:heavy-metal-associated domain-containing protein [Microbacterium imperiale]MBP2421423.1 copper chaperone CopZ [Microbacterium imperiale]MDS0199470.1 heavy-metal-associated domain-containing protein [Microbacterium imperiale]BFE41762.1 hypothetical protein GCM10017544_27180 [Microbacterium imperiale]GLJ80714.1 hypothetical protein GCM10017586_23970 [Microbacterium imperiale]